MLFQTMIHPTLHPTLLVSLAVALSDALAHGMIVRTSPGPPLIPYRCTMRDVAGLMDRTRITARDMG